MQLALPTRGLAGYTSGSQRARIATELWGLENLYCANCNSRSLNPSPPNTPAIDFECPKCRICFQLKSQSHAFGSRIVDSAYSKMVREIKLNRTPNLFALRYDLESWDVRDLLLIPSFAFPLSAIEKRKPLALTARRAGWVGCNILLGAIPSDARIPLIANSVPVPPKQVREQYARIRPLKSLKADQRGWTLDILNVVRSLNKREFSLSEVYAHDEELAALHPANRHVRDKIRQQLQILRDLGLLQFLGAGTYKLTR
ncbi:MAG TPA: DpnI domain-containing protein [Candidatus Limnocylindrales bacterium]|nr:DpnI domain-containing protein [Candidatus Limnocylindrales bacterium]